MSGRQPRFNQTTLIDTAPLPAHIPAVKEIGASSAPLLSASFFIGARCKAYNDDFMQCKTEKPGRGELDCLKEGRRVTRCAKSVEARPGGSPCASPRASLLVLSPQMTGFQQIEKLYANLSASNSIEDVNKHCLEEFRKHWTCLDNNNQQLWQCRPAEWKLNKCVFDNLKLEKAIPDAPANETPVHLRKRQLYSHHGP
ncbi:NADH-ubiquinone oxidoreductase 20.8 kDa subunit [Lachnellula suecica]|uniref:NADH-ubiquinone oxidoreductase n=1 Tax=Lachnellula suecica TaxID=602035 RepID=A0A8T9BWQ3_9HELO|nr:NADH-ubiquinone oxidoreductase 20.8 kDa subunit [Lachnellula suecica]